MSMGAGNGLRQLVYGPAGFSTLRSLWAGQNRLNDGCLPGLAALPHLHHLHLPHNLIQWATGSPCTPRSLLAFPALQVRAVSRLPGAGSHVRIIASKSPTSRLYLAASLTL